MKDSRTPPYWEEPPELKRGGSEKYASRLKVLRGYPMRWAVINISSNRDALNAARRYILYEATYTERGEFQVVVRKSGTVWKLYARYLKGENNGTQ